MAWVAADSEEAAAFTVEADTFAAEVAAFEAVEVSTVEEADSVVAVVSVEAVVVAAAAMNRGMAWCSPTPRL